MPSGPLPKLIQKQYPRGLSLTLFTSFDGVPCTPVLQWAFQTLPCNWTNGEDGLGQVPPSEVREKLQEKKLHLLRVVYLFDDPRVTLWKLNKRSIPSSPVAKADTSTPSPVSLQSGPHVRPHANETFSNNAGDSFGFEEHFQLWLRGATTLGVPVLFLRASSSSIRMYIYELACFLHVGAADALPLLDRLPETLPPGTVLSHLPFHQAAQLNKTFSSLLLKMQEVSDCRVFHADGSSTACKCSDSFVCPPASAAVAGSLELDADLKQVLRQLQDKLRSIELDVSTTLNQLKQGAPQGDASPFHLHSEQELSKTPLQVASRLLPERMDSVLNLKPSFDTSKPEMGPDHQDAAARKYIYYYSGTGFNNQRQLFMFALLLARETKRVLLVQPWQNTAIHNKENGTVPFDTIIDRKRLQSFGLLLEDAATVSLDNKTQTKLLPPNRRMDLDWSSYVSTTVKAIDVDVITVVKWLYMGVAFKLSDPIQEFVQEVSSLLYAEHIRFKALAAVRKLRSGKHSRLVVVHYRFGDRSTHLVVNCEVCGWSREVWNNKIPVCADDEGSVVDPNSMFECMLSQAELTPDTAVYIATNKRTHKMVRQLKLLLASHNVSSYVSTDIFDSVEHDAMLSMELSCVEQYIGAYSDHYIPTIPSSWDEFVVDLRCSQEPEVYNLYYERLRDLQLARFRRASEG